MTLDGESFGEEVGWVEEGADVRGNDHLLGDSVPEPIQAKIHRFGLLALDSIMDKIYGTLIATINGGRELGVPWIPQDSAFVMGNVGVIERRAELRFPGRADNYRYSG
jgi:hypothetical protein